MTNLNVTLPRKKDETPVLRLVSDMEEVEEVIEEEIEKTEGSVYVQIHWWKLKSNQYSVFHSNL